MSAVTASILVGAKNRVDLGIQPRWILLLHEAQGYAWHLLRLQLSSGDAAGGPAVSLLEKGPPGTRPGLDAPPGILWRATPDGDLVGELALLLHLHCLHTPEVLSAVRRVEPLSRRRVDLDGLSEAQRGDLRHGIRIARETGGRLYLAATVLAGSRLTEEGLLALPEWEINLATTVLSRDWVRIDAGHLEVTDYRTDAAPPWADDSEQREWADPTGPDGAASDDDDGGLDRRTAEPRSTSAIRQRVQRRERELEEMARQQGMPEAPPTPSPTWLDGFFNEA